MRDCTFCQIIQGRLEAAVVYEDDDHICIMDRRPISLGHTLVISKKHYAILTDIPSMEVGRLFILVAEMAKIVVRTVNAEGFNVGQNNGAAAHQLVPHVHVHIIPRYLKDSSEGRFPSRKNVEFDELKRLGSLIHEEAMKQLRHRSF
jgi:histidine triad (HIT) family protein